MIVILHFVKKLFSIPEIQHFNYIPEEYFEYKCKHLSHCLFIIKLSLLIIGGFEAILNPF